MVVDAARFFHRRQEDLHIRERRRRQHGHVAVLTAVLFAVEPRDRWHLGRTTRHRRYGVSASLLHRLRALLHASLSECGSVDGWVILNAPLWLVATTSESPTLDLPTIAHLMTRS